MKKIILISSVLSIFNFLKAADEIQPSRATLESNVGEMQVEMVKLDNGHWKLNSLLDGGSIVRREESEIFELVEKRYLFHQPYAIVVVIQKLRCDSENRDLYTLL